MRITRTVVGTMATVLIVDANTMLVNKEILRITGTFDNNEKLLKALKKEYEDGVTFITAVLSTEKFEDLYGLDESIFMKYATKLDPKTRKPICEKTAESQPELQLQPQDGTAIPTDPQPQDGMTITAPVTVTEVKAKATKIKK